MLDITGLLKDSFFLSGRRPSFDYKKRLLSLQKRQWLGILFIFLCCVAAVLLLLTLMRAKGKIFALCNVSLTLKPWVILEEIKSDFPTTTDKAVEDFFKVISTSIPSKESISQSSLMMKSVIDSTSFNMDEGENKTQLKCF